MDASATMFCLLFKEWDAAQQKADDAWADVWGRVRAHDAGVGEPPTEHEIAVAVWLDFEAHEWLTSLQRELADERGQIQIL